MAGLIVGLLKAMALIPCIGVEPEGWGGAIFPSQLWVFLMLLRQKWISTVRTTYWKSKPLKMMATTFSVLTPNLMTIGLGSTKRMSIWHLNYMLNLMAGPTLIGVKFEENHLRGVYFKWFKYSIGGPQCGVPLTGRVRNSEVPNSQLCISISSTPSQIIFSWLGEQI